MAGQSDRGHARSRAPLARRAGECQSDQALASAVLAGNPGARQQFTRLIADVVWSSCKLVAVSPGDAATAFADVMNVIGDDGYARLAAYDGRYPLLSYVVMVVREILSARVLNLLALEGGRGWRAIESFFQQDIHRIIRQKIPASLRLHSADDAYQSICLALVDNNMHRLRSYRGIGSFTGFVLHAVERLAIDYVRSVMPRRRLPAMVAKLPPLEQHVFRLVYWDRQEHTSPEFADMLFRRLGTRVSADAIATAIDRVRRCLPQDFGARVPGRFSAVPLDTLDTLVAAVDFAGGRPSTPETDTLDREEDMLLSAALNALRSACSGLSESEALFLRHLLSGLPPRQIAPLMGLAVADVNQLRQRVIRYLVSELRGRDAVKNWLASVNV